MAEPTARRAPPVVLLWGDHEFLLREAARELIESHGGRATEVEGDEWRGGETSDLATPSLWGDQRALLVSRCQALSEAALAEVRGYIASPSPDALCVLAWVTRGRSAPPLGKAVEVGGGAVRHVAVGRRELSGWILERARRRGVDLTKAAADALMSAIGEDPAALDQSVEQLAGAFAGRRIGPEEVRRQFQGLGEQRVWDLCDLALAGRIPQALVVLRSLLEAREDPLLVLGGIAARVRDLIRVKALTGGSASDVAKEAGLRFDWQVRRYREQASRFAPGRLVALHERVVEADRALKGGMAGEIVLASLVNVMGGEESAALNVPVRVSR